MKIIVTGAAGFIGSHLAEELASCGHDVVGLDCFTDYYSLEIKKHNAAQVLAKGVPVLELDLAEDPLEEVLDSTAIVCHCAAQPGISQTTPFDTYLRNNVVATHRLVSAARAVSTLMCFINVSTSSVYGRNATDAEDAAPQPTSFYGVTKLAAEQLVLAFHRQSGFPACSLRIFSVYGPRERPDKLFPKLIDGILTGRPFPLCEGSLEHSRSFTYVGDIVQAFKSVLDNIDASIGQVFNIGSGAEITTGEAIQTVERILGKKARFSNKPRRAGDQLHTHANITKARRILGYEPATKLEDGLRQEVEWRREVQSGKLTT